MMKRTAILVLSVTILCSLVAFYYIGIPILLEDAREDVWMCCENGNTRYAGLVLRKHPSLVRYRRGGSGETALHHAAEMGQTGMVELLLDLGADLEAKDSEGKTPLLVALGAGHPGSASCLIDAGADVLAADRDGKNSLYYALNPFPDWRKERVSETLVQLLRDRGVPEQDETSLDIDNL